MKLILNVYEILKMKKTTGLLIFLIAVFQLLGCSSPEKTNSQSSTSENKPINSTSESTTFANEPANIGKESFAKEQKSKFEAMATELERNRRLWQESKQENKIVSYDFVCGQFTGGVSNPAEPVLIKVREGQAISIEPVSKSEVPRINGYENFNSVDKMFDYMRQELEKGRMLNVKYHKKLAYPERITIIYSYELHGYLNIIIEKFESIK